MEPATARSLLKGSAPTFTIENRALGRAEDSEEDEKVIICNPDCALRHDPTLSSPLEVPHRQPENGEQARLAPLLYTSTLHPWQTRLLALGPGRLGQELVAHLVVVDLIHGSGAVVHKNETLVEYTALSYTWGAPDFDHRIRIDDHCYPITENLYIALQRIRRSSTKEQYWWIDALCINQHDRAERSSQVANMITMFWKAKSVRVWLGECGSNVALALQYLGSAEKLRYPPSDLDIHHEHCATRSVSLYFGLCALYGRDWFGRIWIRQEIWAARDVLVQCGDSLIAWENLANCKNTVSEPWQVTETGLHGQLEEILYEKFLKCVPRLSSLHRGPPGVVGSRPEQRRAVRVTHRILSEGQVDDHDSDILEVLLNAKGSACGDPRDHIFGLLGMSRDRFRSPDEQKAEEHDVVEIIVDYSKAIGEVFADLARYVILRDRHFGILFMTGTTYGTHGGLDLPTWTPDWRYSFGNDGHVPRVRVRAVDGSILEPPVTGSCFSCRMLYRYRSNHPWSGRDIKSVFDECRINRRMDGFGVLTIPGRHLGTVMKVPDWLNQDSPSPSAASYTRFTDKMVYICHDSGVEQCDHHSRHRPCMKHLEGFNMLASTSVLEGDMVLFMERRSPLLIVRESSEAGRYSRVGRTFGRPKCPVCKDELLETFFRRLTELKQSTLQHYHLV